MTNVPFSELDAHMAAYFAELDAADEYDATAAALRTPAPAPPYASASVKYFHAVDYALASQGAAFATTPHDLMLCAEAEAYGVGPYDCAAQIVCDRLDAVAPARARVAVERSAKGA